MWKVQNKYRGTFCDYVVVGTGPAGAVIARILSNDRKNSVLVLEAGENNDHDKPIKDSKIAPILEEKFFAEYFWQGEGIPQKGVDARTFEWTTGRLSGGGSSINGEQYVRPTPAVLQAWQRLLGPLWSPYRATLRFRALENYNGRTTNMEARGFHGRLDIRQAPRNPTTMAQKLVTAIERATGHEEILDYNDPRTPLGPFTRWQLYQQPNGQRESASTAFLSPDVVNSQGKGERGRKLEILYGSTALRILFRGKRAVGIEFLHDGKCSRVYARKKVIVSAGINSTQLLMLSGIGPAKMLRDAGIPVILHNENVGKQLRNHTLNTATFTTNPNDPALPLDDPNALYTGGAFLPDPRPGADKERRAVQLIGIGSSGSLNIAVIYLRPRSRGSMKIQSKDPLKIVLGDEGFLDNSDGLEAIKSIFRVYIRGIANEFQRIDSQYRLVSPSTAVLDDDAQLEEFIKQNFGHNHHQQGALKMAPRDKGGVVDRRGNVYGVHNLIVADDSLVPFTVDGNASAPAYLIGYTIAHQLLKKPTKKRRQRVWFEE